MIKKIFLALLVLLLIGLLAITGCNKTGEAAIEGKVETIEEQIEEVKEEIIEPEEEIVIEPEEYEEIDKLSNVLQKASQAIVLVRFLFEETDEASGMSMGSLSTGTIYTEDGYIITSDRGLGNIKEISVTLPDGTQLPGDLVGEDKNTTIVIIKIDAQNLESLDFTTFEDIKVGEAVLSISKPFGGALDFPQGFVTATGVFITFSPDTLPFVDLIQTDIEAKPGFAGGVLVNMNGSVIGINSLGMGAGGGKSLLFATPSSIATNIANQIIEYGRAIIPFLGVEMGISDSDISGVSVVGLVENTPAVEADLKVEDIIVEIDRVEVKDPYQLYGQILRKNVGDLVKLKIYRDGDYITLEVNLMERP